MKILLFRAWRPYDLTATFATIESRGVGGTEFQLLLHARACRDLGHEVVVFGVSHDRVTEEDILFEASPGGSGSPHTIAQFHSDTALVLLNDTHDVRPLRDLLPQALFVQVCQNGPNLAAASWVDLFAFVGEGQLARYALKHRRLRHRFVLLPNAVPWETAYKSIPTVAPSEQLIWVGAYSKPGLHRWGVAMANVMRDYPHVTWLLCGPSYSTFAGDRPEALAGLDLPSERVSIRNFALHELGTQIARSAIHLASLGGEDGPVSYLDGHALGVPVLCGNDIVGVNANPAGMGFRVTTPRECERAIRFLLENKAWGRRMGAVGRDFVLQRHTEVVQRTYLEALTEIALLWASREGRQLLQTPSKSDQRYPLWHRWDRARIRLAALGGRS